MRQLFTASVLLITTAVLTGGCQTGPIVPQDAWVERVSTGHKFTEGPAGDGEGHVYFTDIPPAKIHRIEHASGKISLFRRDSGGANGLMFDDRGRLYICEGDNRRVTRLHPATGKLKVLASHYGLNRLNSPNDLDLDSEGGVYFTDPRYGDRASMQMNAEGVYYIPPDGGDLMRVIEELERPNGLILSRDEKTLYVADHAAKNIHAYDVNKDGSLSNGRVFAWLDQDAGGPDGMTLDARGNVYAAAEGGVWVWSPEGELLKQISVPEHPSNVTFAGPERRWLYVTARNSVYRIKLGVRGHE